MRIFSNRTPMILAAFGLAACGGSGTSSSFSAADQDIRTFAADSGDVGAAFESGATLSSRAGSAVGVQLRFDGGTTNLTDASVAVSKNADGELTATLNDESRVFTVADRKVESDGMTYGYEFRAADGTTFSLFHFGGSLEDLVEGGNGFGTVVSLGADLGPENDTLYHRSFAAIGGETTDAVLGAKDQTVSYSGSGRIDLYPAENFINSGTSRSRVRGDVTFDADFAAGEISGFMNDLTLQAAGSSDRLALDGQIDLNSATFTDNTFEGSVTGSDELLAAGLDLDDNANYNGAFFGPDAEEVHGVISGTGALNGVNVNAIGYFTQ